jgi:hypothetical protein
MAWSGLARLGMAGKARCRVEGCGTVCRATLRQARQSTAWPGDARRVPGRQARQAEVSLGEVRSGRAWQVWHGGAEPGAASMGKAVDGRSGGVGRCEVGHGRPGGVRSG